MQIQIAKKEDFAALVQFYTRMNEVINKRTNHYNPDNAVFPSEAMIADAIESEGQFVGIEDGQIAAACIVNHECSEAYLTANWQIAADRSEFWVLHALRVALEYEGRGYAKQMIAHVIEEAPRKAQKAIRLDCMEGYAVNSMYERMGFQYIDTIEILYEDIGYPERFRLLEKVIG